jgi:hypothetical protein
MQSVVDLFVSDMPKFSGGISPLLKKHIIHGQLLHDMHKQVDTHPKMATKLALVKCWILRNSSVSTCCGHRSFRAAIFVDCKQNHHAPAFYLHAYPIVWLCLILLGHPIPHRLNRTTNSSAHKRSLDNSFSEQTKRLK